MAFEKEMGIIRRDTVEIINEEDLLQKLNLSRPLRVKLGLDPSRPDVHLGHAVVLRKLRQFQDMGHTAVLIIGDYTAMIGDPSGRSQTRPALTHEEVVKNCRTYEEQVYKILDPKKVEMVRNGEWLGRLTFKELLQLASHMSVARLLERDDFERRLDANEPMFVHELLYPLMQGYDSVMVRADIELGGTDQKFNFLVGRMLQKAYGQEPQVVLTLPLIEGTDGAQKMSKSLDNYIGVTDPAPDMFGKLMSVPDELMFKYITLLSDTSLQEVEGLRRDIRDGKVNPMEVKKDLAKALVVFYHDAETGERAREGFEKTFQKREFPEDAVLFEVPGNEMKEGKIWVVKLLSLTGLVESNAEAQRLIKQGAVVVDGVSVTDAKTDLSLDQELKIQVGKRRFIRARRAK